MYSLAMELRDNFDIKLSVCTVYSGNDLQIHKIEGITYYLLPQSRLNTKYDRSLEPFWKLIVDDFNPDIIHIHGTEYAHGLASMNACPSLRFVISIQGMVGVYYHFYYAGIRLLDIIRHLTFNDLRKKNSILDGKKDFWHKGKIENEYLRKTQHIIGRTSWDFAHVKAVNPSVSYHLCNEVLRRSFYESTKWGLALKTDFSIFISQAGYPIKGLHQVLKALPIVKSYYPNTKLRIAGPDITRSSTIREKINIGGYGAYLSSLLDELNLRSYVTFLGPQDEAQMIREYQNAHVFVCPSSIENSPNSVGEAQIIGTPCIASYVGGVPDMITDEETGLLYRFEDHVMLAFKIIRVFEDEMLAVHISQNGQAVAEKRHNSGFIGTQMQDIYSKIIAI